MEEKFSEIVKPTACTIDVTEDCNLACDYCFTWSKHKRRVLSEKIGKNIINWWLPQVDKTRNTQLSWWGGEPLLEWKLSKELTYYAEELAKKLELLPMEFGGTTNGMLYTPDKVEWCLEHRSLYLISLDGIEPAHDYHRKTRGGKGSWKVVDKNTREALKIAPQQRIRSSLSPDTIQHFFESIQYFVEDLGIESLAFSPVFEGNWDQKALELLEEQFELIINYAIKRAKEGSPIVLKHLNDEARVSKTGMPPRNPCGAGNSYTGWSVDGFCFPCHRFNKHGLTTKERSKLPTIIAGPLGKNGEIIAVNEAWRSEFINWFKNLPKQCAECDIYETSVCNGGCYAVNWDMTGSLYKQPQSVCDFNRIQHEAGVKYGQLAEKEGVKLLKSNWGENLGVDNSNKQNEKRGCICYNMCYNQGSKEEIIHIDAASETHCICYNTSYNGVTDPPNTSLIKNRFEKKELRKKFLDLSKRILQTRDLEKTEEKQKLEEQIIEKTIKILEE